MRTWKRRLQLAPNLARKHSLLNTTITTNILCRLSTGPCMTNLQAFGLLAPPPAALKFTTSDSCARIKDEFQLLQAQYHSLELEGDKLASEKSEMQRHHVTYYDMSYGLNIEMHAQTEIVKRLSGICAQVLPYLSQEHQHQVLGATERAKQVTAPELNSIIRQQLQAHQLARLQALALPLTPLPVGLQPPSLPAVSAGTGLLSLSALGSHAHLSKEDKNGHDGDTHQEDDGENSD